MPDPPSSPFADLDSTTVLTAQDVADRMHVDPRSVRRAVARGDLRASRACGLRILAGDAAAWWLSRVGDAPPERRRPAGGEVAAPRAPAPAPPARRRPRSGRLPLPPPQPTLWES